MILFITSQDEPTSSNFKVAGYLAATAAVAMCGEEAVRKNALAALGIDPTSAFLAFCHGEATRIRGHDEQTAINIDDLPILLKRSTFAFACHTAAILGSHVAAAGGTWFGFVGRINCLPADTNSLQYFKAIIDFITKRFPKCNSVADAESFVDGLDTLSGDAIDAIGSHATLEQALALREITRKLRIWLPHADEAVKHPEAYGDPVIGIA